MKTKVRKKATGDANAVKMSKQSLDEESDTLKGVKSIDNEETQADEIKQLQAQQPEEQPCPVK